MFKQSITGVSGAVTLKWLSQEEEVQSQCLNLKDGVFLCRKSLEIASGPVEWTEKKIIEAVTRLEMILPKT